MTYQFATRIISAISLTNVQPNPDAISEAALLIQRGEVVAFPTETVYGLGANAENSAAVARIFEAKGRPSTDPLIVHIASIEDVPRVAAEIPAIARTLMDRFWPGPLTLVMSRTAHIPSIVSSGLPTVGVRMPAHPVALALLRASGVPIAAPSANLFAHSSPTSAQHVYDDLAGRIPLILDGGSTQIGVESTIVDVSSDIPKLLRPGGVPLDTLRSILPAIEVVTKFAGDGGAVPAPGMLLKHYSPHAEMRLFDGSNDAICHAIEEQGHTLQKEGKRVGLLIADEDQSRIGLSGVEVITIGTLNNFSQVAHNLFAGLRELDARKVDVILARSYPANGLGLAIRDRLLRAAEGRITLVGDTGLL